MTRHFSFHSRNLLVFSLYLCLSLAHAHSVAVVDRAAGLLAVGAALADASAVAWVHASREQRAGLEINDSN